MILEILLIPLIFVLGVSAAWFLLDYFGIIEVKGYFTQNGRSKSQ